VGAFTLACGAALIVVALIVTKKALLSAPRLRRHRQHLLLDEQGRGQEHHPADERD